MKKSSGSDLVRGFSGYSGYCQAITRIELSMQVNTRSGHHLIFFLLEGRTKRDVTNGRWQSFFSWLFDYIKSSTFTRPQNCLFLAKPIKCQGLGMMILPQLNVSESLRAEDSAKTQNVMLAWKKRKYCQDLNIIKKSQTCILLLSYCIIRTLSGWYWFQHCPDTSFGLECENDQTLHQDVLGSKLPPTSRFHSVRSYVWSFNWTVDISFSRASGNLLVVEESQPNTSPLSTWPQRDLGFSILYLFRKKINTQCSLWPRGTES